MNHPNFKLEMIFGIRPIIEAIDAGKNIEKVLVQNNLNGELIKELLQRCNQSELPTQKVPVAKLNRVTKKNHQGAIAIISPITYNKIEQIIPFLYEQGEVPLILILDRITDVRNFGAICRTAECAGVHAVVIPDRGAAQINADAIKTSAGALYNIPICRASNIKDTIAFLKESGLKLVACSEKSDKYYNETELNAPVAIIMGSEEDGISPPYIKLCDESVKIPIMGKVESLNVSVATAVILYEAVRQRNS